MRHTGQAVKILLTWGGDVLGCSGRTSRWNWSDCGHAGGIRREAHAGGVRGEEVGVKHVGLNWRAHSTRRGYTQPLCLWV
jgi:hypothetical protein